MGERQPAAVRARQWVIQRCINAYRNEYEDWPGYCERLLTREEMLVALRECDQRWPEHEFRGHNVANQRLGLEKITSVSRNIAVGDLAKDVDAYFDTFGGDDRRDA